MKIAAVQLDITLGESLDNLAQMERLLREANEHGAELIIFPECAVPGYCFESSIEAAPHAESIPGPATDMMHRLCRELGCHVVFGMLEEDGTAIYNVAVLVGPLGVVGVYRKTHLPFLGIDMHTTHGNRPLAVFEAGGIRVGMLICYDIAFPEPARVLALLGADLIVVPTNWPPGAETTAAHVINTRGLENHVYCAAVNRVGMERGFRFIGHSRIVDPTGRTVADAPHEDQEILYAEIDPSMARRKHIVRIPDLHEIDRFADRRPDIYGPLTDDHQLASPRDKHAVSAVPQVQA